MPHAMQRSFYADMFGPTTGDRVRLADTDLIIEVEKDFTTYGEEVKFGGGKVIRDGMGQSQTHQPAGRGRHRHHQRADPRSLGHRQGRRRHQGRPHLRHRQGRQSRHPARRDHRHRPRHRGDRRRRQDPHRRRLRHPHPFHLPAAGGRGADVRRHLDAGRRHRPGGRHQRHHLHARPVAHRAHDPGGRRLPGESRLRRQGQCVAPGGAGGNGQGRRLRAQAARGLGHDAGRDRLLPVGRGRLRRAGDDPHRHARTNPASSRTRSRRSRAAPFTPSTPKAPAAAMRPTSSRSPGSKTCCRRRPIRRGRSPATPSTSISTC